MAGRDIGARQFGSQDGYRDIGARQHVFVFTTVGGKRRGQLSVPGSDAAQLTYPRAERQRLVKP